MKNLGEQILELRAQGLSYKQIKAQLNCSSGSIAYHCGVGQKEKSQSRKRDARNSIVKYIQEYKQQSGCIDCKENYPYWVLEFDHLGDKSFNISGFRSKTVSLDKVKEEIAKCEVVCSNCHKNRTFMRILKTGGDVMDVSKFYE